MGRTDGADSAVLMKNADMALYRAKERGRHSFQFFVEAMNRAAERDAVDGAAHRRPSLPQVAVDGVGHDDERPRVVGWLLP